MLNFYVFTSVSSVCSGSHHDAEHAQRNNNLDLHFATQTSDAPHNSQRHSRTTFSITTFFLDLNSSSPHNNCWSFHLNNNLVIIFIAKISGTRLLVKVVPCCLLFLFFVVGDAGVEVCVLKRTLWWWWGAVCPTTTAEDQCVCRPPEHSKWVTGTA